MISSMENRNYILEYWEEIESGRILVSSKVKTIYKKLVDEIQNPVDPWVFDVKKATKPIRFIEKYCKHSKGEWSGRPVRLELFQKAFISALFGFVHKETGLRKYTEAFFMVARKNGKSTMLAGIALYLLVSDQEPGAELYTVATKKDQAKLIFDEVQNMMNQSPALKKILKKRKSDIYFEKTFSKMQALGKNSDTLDGLNAHGVIMDELHGVKDRNLYEVMKQSQSARRQPLMIMITTAGTVRECIFDDIYEYAENILKGTVEDPRFLPIVYELDEAKEWQNPKMWIKANPGLGTIKKIEDLVSKVERAKQSAKDRAGLLTKDFNIRGTHSTSWLTFDEILNESTFNLEDYRGSYCIGGADLSITTDLTCATILMYDHRLEKYIVHQMYWIPEDNVEERVKTDKIPYDVWHDKGLVRYCSGNTINYSDVTAWFKEIVYTHGITPAWIYYDSYSARYWVEEMESNGFRMIRCIQGAKTLSLPMQTLGADLQAKRIIYNNNPVLKWCLTNTGIQTDRNGNIVPIKNRSAKQRIDGTASLLDAYVGLGEHYSEFMNL